MFDGQRDVERRAVIFLAGRFDISAVAPGDALQGGECNSSVFGLCGIGGEAEERFEYVGEAVGWDAAVVVCEIDEEGAALNSAGYEESVVLSCGDVVECVLDEDEKDLLDVAGGYLHTWYEVGALSKYADGGA